MNAASGPLLNALRDVRHSVVFVAALADAVILGRPMDAANALAKLPEALRLLGQRVVAASQALEGTR
jgi:hypothetical protein